MKLFQGDLVLISYPFSDFSKSKVRPALVISKNKLNHSSKDFIAVPITGIIKKEDFSIIINSSDLVKGNLIKESRIRFDKVFCVSSKLVLGKIGITDKKILKIILRGVKDLF